jgi:predicted dienelactone hydrolase
MRIPALVPAFRPASQRRERRLEIIKKIALLTAFLVLLPAGYAQEAQDFTHIAIAGREVAVWKPSGGTPQDGFPVIVFSHGYLGCNTQSVFLMEALAQAGYLVLAPNHQDARCGGGGRTWHPQERFGLAQEWSDATYKDRATDIKMVLGAVLQGKAFQGVTIDHKRVGIAGHSLGGYTALGVAGAWPSWKDNRIKAVLALSPFCSPFVSQGDLPHLNVPVMYQGGTRDLGITPTVSKENGAYDRSSPPKLYVEFDGAGHLAWTNLNPRYQSLINSYSVAFFDHYLKRSTQPDALAPLLGNPPPQGVSKLRVDLK